MPETEYRGRRAWQIQSDSFRVTVLVEGGHIAEMLYKPAGVNPLWTPPWPSIEPSQWSRDQHPEYGTMRSRSSCLGLWATTSALTCSVGPLPKRLRPGLTVHGDASIWPCGFEMAGESVQTTGTGSGVGLVRTIRLDGDVVRISEEAFNATMHDRPVAWTQHVTLGPPFLEKGLTRFEVPATRSRTLDERDFDWPYLPRPDGSREDLRVLTNAPSSGGFTTHLMDPSREQAFFLAWSPTTKMYFGYVWRQVDFPWLGIWEENYSRTNAPWNGKTLTRGMEFGVSPFPESRRKMIDRGSLFGVPAYRWLPAGTGLKVEYAAFAGVADRMPLAPPDQISLRMAERTSASTFPPDRMMPVGPKPAGNL